MRHFKAATSYATRAPRYDGAARAIAAGVADMPQHDAKMLLY